MRFPQHADQPTVPAAAKSRPHSPCRNPERVTATGAANSSPGAVIMPTLTNHTHGPDPTLTREDPERFRALVIAASEESGIDPVYVERDYWMFQIAQRLLGDSEKYPGSFTSMGGGSALALVGVLERVSEDADFNVSFVGGAAACSANSGKKIMIEYQHRAESLGLPAERLGSGGGNFFRSTNYSYRSVLPVDPSHRARPETWVNSDMGIRDIDPRYLITMPGQPYLSRFAAANGMDLPADLQPRDLLTSHPISALADKLDAVCWRSGQVPMEGERSLGSLASRVRDHYDIYCLLGWLDERDMLSRDRLLAAVEHMRRSDESVRLKRRVNRPQHDRPDAGYHTLPVWHHGTAQYAAIKRAYGMLGGLVYGRLPDFDEVVERVHSHGETL